MSQIEDCVAAGADAVIIGAISYDGLNNLVADIRKKNIPVIDVINGISSPELSAKSLVSFGEMGAKAGEYLAKLHPAGSEPVKVAWFPGPPGAGWVEAGNTGFLERRQGQRGRGRRDQVRRHRQGSAGGAGRGHARSPSRHQPTSSAPRSTAEAAIPILKDRGLTDQVKILSYYFTPGVDQGLRRGQILAAPTDSPVIQGRIAIDQAVRILEGKDYLKHVGPALTVVTKDDIANFDSGFDARPGRLHADLPGRVDRASANGSGATGMTEADRHTEGGSSTGAAPLLETVGISKQYPGVLALDRVDFDLRPGEVHVLFGENGAGKSTLISILAGVQRPTAGAVRFRGEPIDIELGPPGPRARHLAPSSRNSRWCRR